MFRTLRRLLTAAERRYGLGLSGGTTTFLRSDGTEDVPPGSGSSGFVQRVSSQTGAVATGTTTIPLDDTIPQQATEGTQLLSLAITPTDATNMLCIEVSMFIACNAAFWCTTALFQDATANAIAAVTHHEAQVNGAKNVILRHTMVAGTTSATTFKVKSGPHVAGGGNTITLNGNNGTRFFGGVAASSITITEYVP